MKLRVVGWTYYDDDWDGVEISWAEYYAVVDEVKKCGYVFSGRSHQNCYSCTPVLNTGKLCCFSWRGWGGVMAEAHGYFGVMDYARFAFDNRSTETDIRPEQHFYESKYIPEQNLNERFELEVAQDVFASARRLHEIKTDDFPELRYLDAGDTLALICGEEKAEFTVADVDRKKDMTKERQNRLMFELHDFQDEEKMKRAEEELNNAKTILIVKFVL